VALPRDIDARKYSRVAKQRLDEAKLILDKLELFAAAEYMGGYAVECILKALVLTVTPPSQRPPAGEKTVEWLKNEFGHDLSALRRWAAARGAQMPRDIADGFVFVATWDPQSRYELGPGSLESADRFLTAAASIVKWADSRM